MRCCPRARRVRTAAAICVSLVKMSPKSWNTSQAASWCAGLCARVWLALAVKHSHKHRCQVVPIERGRPGPGLLAHVLVSKYCDHLPLARQSHIYAREKVDLHRSTLTDWVGRSTALLEPLADHIGKLVRAGPALFADDTPVKLQLKPK